MCIKRLRLVTMQLPEKFSPIGVGTNRSSHIRLSKEVHIEILIPLFTHAHPALMFTCHTAPKL
jgi:hypothetical protein